MIFDPKEIRKEFLALERGLVYLDSAATALKPRKVVETLTDFYSKEYSTVHRSVYERARVASEKFLEARKKVQCFLNAKAVEEIIFTRNTTASINLLARSYGAAFLKPGDLILITEIEHHSNMIPWQMVAKAMQLNLEYVRVTDEGMIDLGDLQQKLKKGAKLLSLAHVSNITGVIQPVEKVIAMAHEMGARVCLDGAQAAAHLLVDVQKLDVDFYAFSSHKLYGPTGVGVLYGKRELLEHMEPVEGGGDMVAEVSLQESRWLPLPQKFEAGTGAVAEVIAFGEALDFISTLTLQRIGQWESFLIQKALELFSQIPGVHILGNAKAERGSLISFSIDGVHPLDLATLLDCKKIAIRTGHLCSQPAMARFGLSQVSRLSVGLYNTHEDLDHFFEALKWSLSIIKP